MALLLCVKENQHRKNSICISKSYSDSELRTVGVFCFLRAIGTYLLLPLLIKCSILWQILFTFFFLFIGLYLLILCSQSA